jgi:hypothetical protein
VTAREPDAGGDKGPTAPADLNWKNALFIGSDEGGDNWAVIATLIKIYLSRHV